MNGISMDERKDFLKTNHEIEFTYRNEEYTIEPGGYGKTHFVLSTDVSSVRLQEIASVNNALHWA